MDRPPVYPAPCRRSYLVSATAACSSRRLSTDCRIRSGESCAFQRILQEFLSPGCGAVTIRAATFSSRRLRRPVKQSLQVLPNWSFHTCRTEEDLPRKSFSSASASLLQDRYFYFNSRDSHFPRR